MHFNLQRRLGRVLAGILLLGSVTLTTSCASATYPIVGFYGAINDGGTFVRTVEHTPITVGERIRVTGTSWYDGTWTVLQTFPYRDPRDPQELWGYLIGPKWRGFPPGFTNDGGVPSSNKAQLQRVR